MNLSDCPYDTLTETNDFGDISDCFSYSEFQQHCWCNFSIQIEDCVNTLEDGYVNYIDLAFCKYASNENLWIPGIEISYFVLLLWYFVLLAGTADAFFVPVVQWIAIALGMSETLAGVTIVAIGNAGPDIASSFAAFGAMDAEQSSLVFGSFLGGGMMVMSVLVAIICFMEPFHPARRPFYRDCLTYMLGVSWLFGLYMARGGEEDNGIYWYDAMGFLIVYAIYVIVVVSANAYYEKEHPPVFDAVGRKKGKKSYYLKDDNGTDNAAFDEGFEDTEFPPPGDNKIYPEPPASPMPSMTKNRTRTISNVSNLPIPAPVDTRTRTLSHLSTVSVPASPVPSMAKNRTRTISNVSAKPPPSVRNTAILSPLDELPDMTDIEENSKTDHQEENAQKKKWLKEIRNCIRFCDEGDFQQSNILGKTVIILFAPIYICCKWTIPVLPLDRSQYATKWNKPLAMLQAFAIPIAIYVFTYQYNEPDFGCTISDVTDECEGGFPRYAVGLISGTVFSFLIFIFSNLQTPPAYWSVFPWIGFFTGIMWQVPTVIMGLTFLAIANNLGDFIADPTLAKDGQSRMGFSACYGGPLMNLFLGTGLACLVTTLMNPDKPIPLAKNDIEVTLYCGVMTCGIAAMVMLPARGFRADYIFGVILILIYVVALTICFLLGFEVISF